MQIQYKTMGLTYPLISPQCAVTKHYLGTLSGQQHGKTFPVKRILSQLSNFCFKAKETSFRVVLVSSHRGGCGLLVIVSASHILILYSAQAAVLIGCNLFFY
jgi:hypothetical protein